MQNDFTYRLYKMFMTREEFVTHSGDFNPPPKLNLSELSNTVNSALKTHGGEMVNYRHEIRLHRPCAGAIGPCFNISNYCIKSWDASFSADQMCEYLESQLPYCKCTKISDNMVALTINRDR